MTASTTWPPWIADLRELHGYSAGVFLLPVVRAADLDVIVTYAATGRPDAILLLTAVMIGARRIKPSPEGQDMPCLACNRPVEGRLHGYGVAVPDIPEPPMAVALPVCGDCATEPDAIRAALMPTLRIVWPNVRTLAPVAGVGHA